MGLRAAPARAWRATYTGLSELGDQVSFYARSAAGTPVAVTRYRKEVVRLLAEVSLGRGALVLVAGTLGIPMSDIEVIHGDTGRTPFGLGTYGSRSAAVGGSAVLRSAEKVRDKVIKIAAHQLEAAVEDMVYDNSTGTIYVKGSPNRSKKFAEIAVGTLTAHQLPDGMEPGLEETTFFDPPNFTFPASAHIALVEVDPERRPPARSRPPDPPAKVSR